MHTHAHTYLRAEQEQYFVHEFPVFCGVLCMCVYVRRDD